MMLNERVLSETVKPEFLKERKGIIYKKKVTNKPYSGYVEDKKENGFLVRGTYQNGKKEGIWKTYDWDVQLWTKRTFKDGKLDGVSEIYYDNGRLENKVNYKNGKRIKEENQGREVLILTVLTHDKLNHNTYRD